VPEGHTIHRLAAQHKDMFVGAPVRATSPQGRFAAGAALIDGRVLEGTDAHGKHLFHRYADDVWLHVHLGLYGAFSHGSVPPPEPRGALRLRLVGETAYADLRGPTACEVIETPRRTELLARLGPDPLRADADPAVAWRRISTSRAPMGALLLNQAVLSGVGNVYRSELLFRAGIPPHRLGQELTAGEWDAMWADLCRLMRAGVRSGRIVTTRPEDRQRPGRAAAGDRFYVYRRVGEPCRRCGTPVRAELMAARTVSWCPTCQPPAPPRAPTRASTPPARAPTSAPPAPPFE
jgi:endonuclease-8